MLQKIKNRIKEQRGFTLVELLAVIVILGIIAAIAVPAIGNIIENAREDAEIAEGISIINAAKIYRAQNPEEKDGIDYDDLKAFIDNVKEENQEKFTVSYVENESGSEYRLNGSANKGAHPAIGYVTTNTFATEAELIEGRSAD